MRSRIALAAGPLALLAACSAASPAPKGWQPVPGASAAWTTGSGSALQEYRYSKSQFAGTLSDLASQVTISALMQQHGAKFQGSVPFAPCPGAAGVATFLLPRQHETLQEGFSVQSGRAVRVSYLRPIATPIDSNATQAMQNALCAL